MHVIFRWKVVILRRKSSSDRERFENYPELACRYCKYTVCNMLDLNMSNVQVKIDNFSSKITFLWYGYSWQLESLSPISWKSNNLVKIAIYCNLWCILSRHWWLYFFRILFGLTTRTFMNATAEFKMLNAPIAFPSNNNFFSFMERVLEPRDNDWRNRTIWLLAIGLFFTPLCPVQQFNPISVRVNTQVTVQVMSLMHISLVDLVCQMDI